MLKIIILSYSLILFFPNVPQFGIIWAIITFSYSFVLFLKNPNLDFYSKSILKTGIIFFITLLVSILLNQGLTLKKIQIIKYIFPLVITAFSLNHFRTLRNLILLNKYIKWLSFIIFLFLLYEFGKYGFSIRKISIQQDNILLEKSHVISQLYSALIFLFFATQIKLSKFNNYQLIFLFPLIFTGARSVLLGAILFVVTFLLLRMKVKLKFLFFSIISSLFFIFLFKDLIIQIIYSTDFFLFEAFIDKSTFNRSSEINTTTFTSGRDLIFNYYESNWTIKDFFIGNGMSYLNPNTNFGFRLHNDFFEFFFSFGAIALIIMIVRVYYFMFYKTYILARVRIIKTFIFALTIFFVVVSFTNSILDYQSVLYLYLSVSILNLKINNNECKI